MFLLVKEKDKGEERCYALKLDMSKAYDMIEWELLEVMLRSMGFPIMLVSLIMRCINMVSYEVLINGQPRKCFSPERGFRQGDPLSPYLFILCANMLPCLISLEVRNKNINGVRVYKNANIISHIFFTDDNMSFVRANPHEVETIMKTFQAYQKVSGHMVNLEKTGASFSHNELLQTCGSGNPQIYHEFLQTPSWLLRANRMNVGQFLVGRKGRGEENSLA